MIASYIPLLVLAPREFVVDLDLNEFQCKYRGCKKSFRKASSRDNHQRYFHSPRAPQKRHKLPPARKYDNSVN